MDPGKLHLRDNLASRLLRIVGGTVTTHNWSGNSEEKNKDAHHNRKFGYTEALMIEKMSHTESFSHTHDWSFIFE